MIKEIHYKKGTLSQDLKEKLKSLFLKNENKVAKFIPFDLEIKEMNSQIFENQNLMVVSASSFDEFRKTGYRIIVYHNEHNELDISEIHGSLIISKSNSYERYSWLKELDVRKNFGKVFITGFGPGDPDLLTIKALKIIEGADIIYYDDLIDQNFLNRFQAKKIYVGKRKGNHSYSQEQINFLLYESAVSGKNTVRLKGGDPFIFGRGGEELYYLQDRFIEVEIIPGISAAFGAASTGGIPLTLRGISSSVAFCTGFPKRDKNIPNADTLVFYMSASNIQETALLLLQNGRMPETPVALIRNATLHNQETIYTNLHEISKGNVSLPSPMVAIIGEVARQRTYSSGNDIDSLTTEILKNTVLEPF